MKLRGPETLRVKDIEAVQGTESSAVEHVDFMGDTTMNDLNANHLHVKSPPNGLVTSIAREHKTK